MTPMRTLSASGMQLEPQTAAHAEAMFAVLNDSAVFTYIDEAPPASVTALRDRYARLETRLSADGREHWLNWVIRLDGGPLAGFVQATVVPNGLAWIAFVLGRGHWGRNHAWHASRAMLDELASRYGVTRWLATADRDNRRSIALLKRLGFELADDDLRSAHDVAANDVLLALALDASA